MDVAAHGDGRLHRQDCRLGAQDGRCVVDQALGHFNLEATLSVEVRLELFPTVSRVRRGFDLDGPRQSKPYTQSHLILESNNDGATMSPTHTRSRSILPSTKTSSMVSRLVAGEETSFTTRSLLLSGPLGGEASGVSSRLAIIPYCNFFLTAQMGSLLAKQTQQISSKS